LAEIEAFRWDEQPHSLPELAYILSGCDAVFGQPLDTVDGALTVASQLLAERENVLLENRNLEEIRAKLQELRQIETPENAAERKFNPLLNLRSATRHFFDLQKKISLMTSEEQRLSRTSKRWKNIQETEVQIAALHERRAMLTDELSRAEVERAVLWTRCREHSPEETIVYDQFFRRGKWEFIIHRATFDSVSCPKEHTRLAEVIAAQLADITRPVKCPSCSVLIIPFPENT